MTFHHKNIPKLMTTLTSLKPITVEIFSCLLLWREVCWSTYSYGFPLPSPSIVKECPLTDPSMWYVIVMSSLITCIHKVHNIVSPRKNRCSLQSEAWSCNKGLGSLTPFSFVKKKKNKQIKLGKSEAILRASIYMSKKFDWLPI